MTVSKEDKKKEAVKRMKLWGIYFPKNGRTII